MIIGNAHAWVEANAAQISPRLSVTILAACQGSPEWPRFLEAVILETLGLQREADKAAAKFEASMAVTDDDRLLAGSLKVQTAPTADELFTVAIAERNIAQANAMTLPSRIRRGEMAKEVKKLRAAKRSTILNAKGTITRVEAAIGMRRQRAGEIEARRGLVETVQLAEGRGDAIAIARSPRIRVERVGGLERANRKGFLDGSNFKPEILYRAGLLYRDKYEMAHGRKTSRAEPGQGGSRSASPRIPVNEIEANLYLNAIRRAFTEPERLVLDAVCGEDRAIGETARLARAAWSTVQKHLVSGLEKVASAEGWASLP